MRDLGTVVRGVMVIRIMRVMVRLKSRLICTCYCLKLMNWRMRDMIKARGMGGVETQ